MRLRAVRMSWEVLRLLGSRSICRRAWRMTRAGVCQMNQRRALCLARDSGPMRQSFWNHLTAASVNAASCNQALFASKAVKGNLFPPVSLTRAMVSSTRAWALMSRSHTAALSVVLSVQCPPVTVLI